MKHSWGKPLKPLEPGMTKKKCTKCGMIRHGTFDHGRWWHTYKQGNKFIDGSGPLLTGTPPCPGKDPRKDNA